ncbi:LOW QUALITY PROTEIN: uncharacterized protein C4orf19-like [Choloepus didactylus]|uniref:LOW QUALITY PROTEIN: uncharacterized protein C4orf19-like n=1 Tax=Choloepus didactylus TaxID=27675 RepID=UPI00189F3AEB|nr:LOW QUALITY PROTEIN: uncharacterized protein C4orf19-like [Choloepus didactylus]
MGYRCCKMIQRHLFDPVQLPFPGYVNEVNSCKLDEEDAVKQANRAVNHLQNEGLRRAERSSAANNIHSTQPFLDGGGAGKQDCVLPASKETLVIPNRGSKEESHALQVQNHTIQIPATSYPQLWGSVGDNNAREEKDCLFQNHTKDEPLERIHPTEGEHDLNTPFSMKRSWESLNEALTIEVLSVYFKEMGPAHAMPVADTRNRREDVHGSNGDWYGKTMAEHTAVAEALAALEAAAAGEDVNEAY